MIRVSPSHFEKMIQNRKNGKITYTLWRNNLSSKLQDGMGLTFYSGDPITAKEMGFLNKVRYHFERNIKNGKFYIKKRKPQPQYFKIGAYQKHTEYNVCEVDLDMAYWQTAYNLGYITTALFFEGCQLSKDLRLMAIGQLAKRSAVYYFDGEKTVRLPDERNHEKEYIWNVICHHVGEIMQGIVNEIPDDAFYLYWVDGFFCKEEYSTYVKSCMRKAGYKSKKKTLHSIVHTKESIEIQREDPESISEEKLLKNKRVFTKKKNTHSMAVRSML